MSEYPNLDGRTENDALIEFARREALSTPAVEHDVPDLYAAILPSGREFKTLDLREYMATPRRKTGAVTLADAESFVAYVKRHAGPGTVLYARREASQVVAVLNDHAEQGPGWGDHRATLALAHTKEWQHWASRDGKLTGQGDFAEHIEQGLDEIVQPPAAVLLELAQHFEAHSKVAFKSVKVLADGSRQLVYEETVEAKAGQKGDVTIPREFQLGIAPYEGTDPYRVTARLKYRLASEQLTIGYSLVRPHDVLKAAFGDVLKAIEDGTGLKPLQGVHG